MPPAPLALSALLGVTALLGVIRLALDPAPFSAESGVLLAIGMSLLSLVTVAGVLVARGRWSRWTAAILGVTWLAVAAAAPLDAMGVGLLIASATVTTMASGPWLQSWLRRRPAADGAPPAAAVLLLLLIGVPAAIGLAEPTAPGMAGWAFSAWSLLLAGGVGRALPVALWAGRLAHGPASLASAWLLGLAGGPVIVACGATQLALLWRRDVRLAVTRAVPTPSAAVPIPPELMDEGIMRAAGLDDRGRPLEDP